MAKILIVMDDINYAGGAHYATFSIANYLHQIGHQVSIYSPVKASDVTRERLCDGVMIENSKNYNEYDFVIVPFENSIFRAEVAKACHVKKIQWIHIDYEKWSGIANVNKEEQAKIFIAYDRIIFVSQHNKESFLRVYPELRERCCVVYNFLDVVDVREKSLQKIDEELFEKKVSDQMNIVLSGRLDSQKAYHRLLDIAVVLRERGMAIEWYILGKGGEYTDLRNRCSKYKIENVHFLGFRKNPYPYIKCADLFAVLSEYEGLAMVAAESLSIGTPVISTMSGGITEVLNENFGWIVENNINAILNKLTELYYHREKLTEKRWMLKDYEYNNAEIESALEKLFECKQGNVQGGASNYMYRNETREEQIEVSVIVPVYNMEEYLEECLNSLVNQTISSYEIVIVNDGSTDNSKYIIEDYVYRYPGLIRAFTIENRGLGEARNYGILKARGRFLGFVDSDDIVRRDMFEIMHSAAVMNCADCVLSDYIAIWESGKKEYVASITFENPDRFDFLKYSSKYGVVNACTKLISRSLFERVKFPKGFYEDLATIPIILSYANKITYVREGLYYYRQRQGSITSVKNNDKRLLDCYKAWDRVLELANPFFRREIEFAVYWSVNFFCTDFLDEFTAKSKAYYDKNREIFIQNEYIQKAISHGEFLDFEGMREIPKTIHYCWFGRGEKSELIKNCIQSWKRYAREFEIIEWNEDNCDIHENLYVEEAYRNKQYAFVSDYFRLKALDEYGGVYLDTDMELIKPIEPYLCNQTFFAFETPLYVHAGIIGAVKHAKIIGDIIRTYDNDQFMVGKEGIPKPIPRRITEVLERDPKFVKNGKTQTISDRVKIYSANIMTMNFHDGNCVANHHYEGSWLKKNEENSFDYGYEVLKHYFTWGFEHEITGLGVGTCCADDSVVLQRDFYKSEYERLENSTCWRITKPLRVVADFFKRILRRKAR